MQIRFPWLAAVLALSVNAPAMGQTSTGLAEPDAVEARAVGHWLYNSDGTKIGSVRRLSDDGQTAVIMVGSYFQPGSHEATLPVTALFVVNGRVTLQTGMAQALNVVAR